MSYDITTVADIAYFIANHHMAILIGSASFWAVAALNCLFNPT